MEVFETKSDVVKWRNSFANSNKTLGFVPTMGALHSGHLSLIKCAKSQNDFVLVSIFVNPSQFNQQEDFEKYPRDYNKDLAMLRKIGCNVVFLPTVEEMYPEEDNRVFDFNGLDKVMEGKFRPGHFQGVAKIVSKLFELVRPHKAYFGEKDFQQLTLIKHLVRSSNYDIEIIACPIEREESGLARSSRNERLAPEERKAASLIFSTLNEAKLKTGSFNNPEDLKEWIFDRINSNPYMDVEYVDFVDANTLKPIESWTSSNNIQVCVAVWAGKVRLIDNIRFNY